MARNRYDSRADRAMKRRFGQAQRRREERIRRETKATAEVVWPEVTSPDEYLYWPVVDKCVGQARLYSEVLESLRDGLVIRERSGKNLSETLYNLILDMTFDTIEPELEATDTPELDEFLDTYIGGA